MDGKDQARERFLRLWQTAQLCGGYGANAAAALALKVSQRPETEVPTPLLISGSMSISDPLSAVNKVLTSVDLVRADLEEVVAVFGDLFALSKCFGMEGGAVSGQSPNVDVKGVEIFFRKVAQYDKEQDVDMDGTGTSV